ncbi:MAG: hypothetical protein ACLUKN_12960 [Bacilli bacterium]
MALIACGKYSDAKKLAPKLGLPDAKMVSAQALAAEGKKSEAIAEYGAYFDSGGRDAKGILNMRLLESGDAIQAGAHFDAASKIQIRSPPYTGKCGLPCPCRILGRL